MTIATIHTLGPAYTVIQQLGGKTLVSKSLDVDKSTLSRWCQPRPAGTGGMIPQRHWPALLKIARRKGVPIGLEELANLKA